jgi:hypothetical protein
MCFVTGTFRQYDYGFILNLIKYRNTKPPEYNIAAITTSVSLLVGPNDWLATPEVSVPTEHLFLFPNFLCKCMGSQDISVVQRWATG